MPNFTVSIDDGCASDVRAAELFEKYGVRCVFYWPVEWHSLAYDNGYEPLTYRDAVRIATHHEIGSHTITHRHLTKISHKDRLEEVVASKYILEQMFPESKITKFCPPRGYIDSVDTEGALKIYDSIRLTKGSNLVHIHPNSGANDGTQWQERFMRLQESGEENIELWGHSWEWDKFNMWQEIEEFLIENTSS